MTRVFTALIVALCLALTSRAASAASNPPFNVYASTYSPVAGSAVTITAQYADANGIPLEDSTGHTVNWSISGSGSLSLSSTPTNGLGIATVTLNASGSANQSCTITAASSGFTSATTMTITTIASAVSAAKYIVTVTNNTAGHDGYAPVLGDTVTVKAQLVDANNNPFSANRTVTFSRSLAGGAFSNFTAGLSTNASGFVSTTVSVGASMTTLVFKATDTLALTGTSLPVTTESASGLDAMTTPVPYIDYSQIQSIFSAAPLFRCTQCHTSGSQSPFYDAPTSNSYSHIVNVTSPNIAMKYILPNDAGNSLIFRKVHETLPPIGGRMPASGALLTGAQQQLFRDWVDQGAHDVPDTTLNKGFTVTVTGTGVPSPVNGTTVTLTAQFLDRNGLAIHNPGMPVSWTLTTGSGGSFANSVTRTDTSGIATTQFTTSTTPGTTYTFRATCGAYTGTSSSITTTLGPPVQYVVLSTDYNPVAGNGVTITAKLADLNGNLVSAFVRNVTFNAAGVGTFTSPNPVTTVGGVATVSYTTTSTPGVGVVITASDPTPTTGSSATITTKFAQYQVTKTVSPVTAGTTITIQAQLVDGNNANLTSPDQVVNFSATGSGFTFTPLSQLSSSGLASVSFTPTKAGSVTITAAGGTANGTLTFNVTAAGPHDYAVSSTSTTTPTVNTSITVTAQLEDQFGNPTGSGQLVTFSAGAPGGTFVPITATADSNGLATTTFTASTTAGTFLITATDILPKSGTLSITSQAGPAVKYIVTPASTSVTVGTNNINVTAKLVDTFNNLVSATRTVTWSIVGIGGSLSTSTSTTVGGQTSITFNAPTLVGTDTITANDGTDSGSSATISINAGLPNQYVLTSNPVSSPIAGSSVVITAQLADLFGNPLTSSSGTMNWSKLAGTGGGFPATSPIVNGVASMTFNTLATQINNLYTVKGIDGSLLSGTVSFTAVAGPPTQCQLGILPASPVVGTPVAISGQLLDANGNIVRRANVVLIWSANASGVFLNPTSTTDSNGQVTNSFTTGPLAGVSYVVSATDGGTINGSSASFISVAGAPAAYTVTLSSTTPVAGTNITANAQLTDSFGNALTGAGQTVTWSLSGTTGSFSAPTSVINASGVATITYTTSKTSGDTEKITATTGAFTGTSPTLTTLAGPAAKYIVTASNTSVAAGSGVRIAALLVDAQGNPVNSAGTSVAWTTTGTNGFFSSPSSITDDTGTAYVVLSTSPTGGVDYVVTAIDSNGLTGKSPDITVGAFSGTAGVAPIITSALSVNTGAGASFSYTITALGSPTITFGATSLPQGLVLSGETITGAVTVAGTYIAHVTASNGFGTDSIDLLIVAAPSLNLSLDRARLKLTFSAQNNDSLGATFSLTLPDGVSAQNATVSIQFGSASFSNLTVFSKTRSLTSVSVKPMTKGSSSISVALKTSKTNLATPLAADGLTNGNFVRAPISLPIQVTISTINSGTFYCSGSAVLSYTAAKGKIGTGIK